MKTAQRMKRGLNSCKDLFSSFILVFFLNKMVD